MPYDENEVRRLAWQIAEEEGRKKPVDGNKLAAKRAAQALADRYVSRDDGPPKLDDLNAMSPVQYGQHRGGLAERLGISKQFLDDEYRERRKKAATKPTAGRDLVSDPEPWPEPVLGDRLLTELSQAVSRHLVLPVGAADAIALWVIFTHAHDCFQASPLLSVSSPSPECGKSTLLTFLAAVVRYAIPASNVTPAALFRAVDAWHPTLLIDEADTFLKDNDELRGIIDSGHNRQFAFLIRTVGDNHEPQRFSTWAPKAIAFIGKMHATLSGRSISIRLKKKLPCQAIEQLRQDRLSHLVPLLRKTARWAADNAEALTASDPQLPPILQARLGDNWRPLLAIADLAGGEWPARARRIAEAFAAEATDNIASVLMLGDVYDLFEARGVDALHSQDIIDHLNDIEDRRWAEWNKGRGVTKNTLATILKSFDVHPRQVWAGDRNLKGYTREHIHLAYIPYLPDRTIEPLADEELRAKQNDRIDDVLSFHNARKPLQGNGSIVLSSDNGVSGDKGDNDPFESLKDPACRLTRRDPHE
jgi:hypothetical protein